MNKTDIYKFKACDNISWYQFCLVSVLNFFAKDEIREILLNGVVYVFSADHSAIKKEKYLLFSNLDELKQYLLRY